MNRANLEDCCLVEVGRYLNIALLNCAKNETRSDMLKMILELDFSVLEVSDLEDSELPRLLAQGILVHANERILAAELEFNYGDFYTYA